MADNDSGRASSLPLVRLVAIGAAAGVMSGLFGVGGGFLIVPLLILCAGLDQRPASASSLLAIVPTASIGAITYAVGGEVELVPACLVAAGAVPGSLVGSFLLRRLRLGLLRWAFVVLLVAVAVWMACFTPERGEAEGLAAGRIAGLIALGLVMGTLSGLFGIGGGVVAVPALMMVFGFSDLAAKGISLLAMIPAAVTGTVTNLRHHLMDWRIGAIIGAVAAGCSVAGGRLAFLLSPRAAAV
ncbi:MAG: sulfite exporter TauE/SafE family protein, partial [Bifidobacteriaceae bacterium]|nr:sulfite exporter TauE/SafE family protein [Bifidobacteriaceae bacterium]